MNRTQILSAAESCVTRDRARTYGPAENIFDAVSQIWAGLDRARGNRAFCATDVALFMAALKLARAAANPAHADSWVDGCGYLACGGEIALTSNSSVGAGQDLSETSEICFLKPNISGADTSELPVAPAAKEPVPDRPSPLSATDQPVRQRKTRKDAWLRHHDNKLISMKRNGKTIDEMARETGRTATAVLGRLKFLNDTRPDTSSLGRVWTDQENKMLLEMRSKGESWDKIAKALDRSNRGCQQRYTKLRRKILARPVPNTAPLNEVSSPADVKEPVVMEPDQHADAVKSTVFIPQLVVAEGGRVSGFGDTSSMTARQRRLISHLNILDDSFALADDLQLAEGLMSGSKPSDIADQLGCSAADIVQRWRLLLTDEIMNKAGYATLDGQCDLLVALRHLVTCEGATGD